jgi:outer membrane protein assembly factor BamB
MRLGRGTGLICVAVMLASGEDWTRFRGPNGSGVSESTGVPAEFGPSKNVVWKTAVPFGRSSPVIAGERIFLTATEGEKLITLCLDRRSGRTLWRREIVRPRVSTTYSKTNDGASPSPVTDGKNVYVFFMDLGLVSYGPDGKERWRLPLGPFRTFYGLGTSPVLAGDTLLMVCDSRSKPFLVAVEANSGRVRWRVGRSEIRFEGYATPVIHAPGGQPAQVVILGANRVDAYALATGEKLWWVRGLGYFPVGSPVLGKDVLVVSTYGSDAPEGPDYDEHLKKFDANKDGRISLAEGKEMMGDEFGALDSNSDGFIDRSEYDDLREGAVGDYGLLAIRLGGRGDLTDTGVAWRYKKASPTVATSVIYKDVLYTVKAGGIINAMDPRTGEMFKTGRAKEATDEYYSSPVAADDKVFFVSETGKAAVVRAGRQWEVLGVNDVGEECYATPAIAGGRIFVRTRGALYCFGAK